VPLFFFVIVTRAGRVDDMEGSELPSLEVARSEAIKDARALMSTAMLDGGMSPAGASKSGTRPARRC